MMHTYKLALLGLLPFFSGACGFIFSHGPPEGHEQMGSFSCTESNTGPIIDVIWGGVNIVGALAAAANPEGFGGEGNYYLAPEVAVISGLGWGGGLRDSGCRWVQ